MKFSSIIAILGAAGLCAALPTDTTGSSLQLVKRGSANDDNIVAVAQLRTNPNDAKTIVGNVFFIQDYPGSKIRLVGRLFKLNHSAKRGLHIHQTSNFKDGCASTGTHFNPFNQTHGARTDMTRHVGDLGNIETNKNGIAIINFSQDLISFDGETNILDRALVLHTGTDDLGLGGNATSLTTGNAGERFACGKITLQTPP